MIASLITLILMGGIIYQLFLTPIPDEESLEEEGLTVEEMEKAYVRDLILYVAGIVITNVVNLII